MKQENKASELKEMIQGMTYCDDMQATDVAVEFVDILINYTKKLEYFRPGPQVVYWEGVREHLTS